MHNDARRSRTTDADPTRDGPAVIAGDFNVEPDSPEVRGLVADGTWTSAVGVEGQATMTWPAADPNQQIDWILGREVTLSEAVLMGSQASDHIGLASTIRPR